MTSHPDTGPGVGEMREAVLRVGRQFHQTRLTHEVHVDPTDLYLVLKAAGYYGALTKAKEEKSA